MKKLQNTPLLALAALCLILGACAHTTDVADNDASRVPPNETGVNVIPIDQTSASVGSTTSSTMNATGPQSRLATDAATMKNGDNNTGAIVTRTGTTVVTRTDTPPSTASVSYRDADTTSVSGTSGTSVSGSTDNTASISGTGTVSSNTSDSSSSMTSNSSLNDQQDTTSTTSTTTSRTRLRKD